MRKVTGWYKCTYEVLLMTHFTQRAELIDIFDDAVPSQMKSLSRERKELWATSWLTIPMPTPSTLDVSFYVFLRAGMGAWLWTISATK